MANIYKTKQGKPKLYKYGSKTKCVRHKRKVKVIEVSFEDKDCC